MAEVKKKVKVLPHPAVNAMSLFIALLAGENASRAAP